MKRIRAKFIKGESVKFLSHLDILRTFERALRRSGIMAVYSKGYNPHVSMSFALPLSVGITSEGELVDIDIENDISADTFINKLNKGLPQGLRIMNAYEVNSNSNIMSIIDSAKYKVIIYGENLENVQTKISDLFSQKTITVEKETKKKKKEIDIKNKIRKLDIIDKDKSFIQLFMELDAGSKSNLNPELVIKSLEKYCNMQIDDVCIHRLELLVQM